MSKIAELLTKVTGIESSINPEATKEELYDTLVIAYNHLKDVIVLQQDLVPVIEDKVPEAKLRNAEDTIAKLTEEVRVLTHWKDGANLEGEQMQAEIKQLQEHNNVLTKQVTDGIAIYNRQAEEISTHQQQLNILHEEIGKLKDTNDKLVEEYETRIHNYSKILTTYQDSLNSIEQIIADAK